MLCGRGQIYQKLSLQMLSKSICTRSKLFAPKPFDRSHQRNAIHLPFIVRHGVQECRRLASLGRDVLASDCEQLVDKCSFWFRSSDSCA